MHKFIQQISKFTPWYISQIMITNNEGAHHAQSIERFLNEIKWRKNHKRFENVMIVYYHRNYLDKMEKIIL